MNKEIYRDRLRLLRDEMQKHEIDAYIILTDDFHGSEYVGDYFKCREYISGFDGSAGTLVVTRYEAGLWTDGRYFIQAAEQLRNTGIELYKMGEPKVPDITGFLRERSTSGYRVGFDGRTMSASRTEQMQSGLPDAEFVTDLDLVGDIWTDRPNFPAAVAWELDAKYTGEKRSARMRRVRRAMERAGCTIHLMTALDDIAWMYNIRGNDIDYNPVAMAYTLLTENSAVLYIAETAADFVLRSALEEDGVIIRNYVDIYEDITKISAGEVLLLDKSAVNTKLVKSIPHGVRTVSKTNPAALMKCVKTRTEQENERQAHIKDGIAVTRLIYWLKNTRSGGLTEFDVAGKLEQLRRQGDDYIGQSFAPIIASGAHGAIVHYEADENTNAVIEDDTFLLMDTGGHYLQGTTDITRTIATGRLTESQKIHYTSVLKGNLNITDAYFKAGVSGNNLDYLAREPLWEYGLDYNHGTGHGVGYLLNVHEGPNAIRLKRAGTPFVPGMITSNEPGVYLEGQYGIRLENLILCVHAEIEGFLKFETLTMVPFDRDAIIPGLLTPKQRKVLNDYHKKVYQTISPYLAPQEREWLAKATAEI